MRKGWQPRGTRRLWAWGLGAWLACCLAAMLQAAEPDAPQGLTLLTHAGEAPPMTASPAPARRLVDPRRVSLGLSPDPVWLRLSLPPREGPAWLYLTNPLLKGTRLYRRGGGGAAWVEVDAPAPSALTGGIPVSRPVFPVATPGDYLLRLDSAQALRFDLRLLDTAELHRAWRDLMLGQGLYFGLVVGLALYNGVLLFGLRDSSYLWYVGFLLGSAAYFLCQNGLLYRAFPGLDPAVNEAMMLTSLSWISVCGLQFCRRFLWLQDKDPRVDLAMLLLWPVAALGVVLAWGQPGHATVVYFSVQGLLVLGLFLVSAGRALERGVRSARWLLLAWSALVAGSSTLLLVTYGLLPHGFWSHHGFQLGSAAESVLLSLALADRIGQLQYERQVLLAEQAKLHDMSYLDGLTGVHNRRYLDEALPAAVIQAEASGAPLSLIMLDLDNFKRFNDGWGHAEGDRALQHLVRATETVIRDIDPVCRYGGEEFVILLRERDASQAREIAERIREELVSRPLTLRGGGVVPLTCTLGVAGWRPGESAEELIARADRALYRGKDAGRDRVVLDGASGGESTPPVPG
ncbi:sensor domain-containing diguanylate cyclase [Halomonas organivorans]